jgi:hypothetical protein
MGSDIPTLHSQTWVWEEECKKLAMVLAGPELETLSPEIRISPSNMNNLITKQNLCLKLEANETLQCRGVIREMEYYLHLHQHIIITRT